MKRLTAIILIIYSMASAEELSISAAVREAIEYEVENSSNFHENRFLVAEEKDEEESTTWIYSIEDRRLIMFDEGQIHPKEVRYSRVSYRLGENTYQTEEDAPVGAIHQMSDESFMKKVLYCYENGVRLDVYKK